MNTTKLKAQLRAPKPAPQEWPALSTGSTLLNLGCNDRPTVGFRGGHYYLFVGDSGSGKTYLTLSSLAEAANNPAFDEYDLIYDGPEYGAEMNFTQHFGSKMAARVRPPAVNKDGTPRYSRTVEEFFGFTDRLFTAGKPFVLVLDSLDVLVPAADIKLAKKNNAAALAEGEQKGTYGTKKAKLLSEGMRMWMGPLQDSGSIIILLAQTRTNIGFGAQFQPKTRSGGNAPTFYAALEIWTSVRKILKKDINGTKRPLGIIVEANVRKNRQTGKPDQKVQVPIYHSVGIDDTGGMVDFLVEEKHWSKSETGIVDAPELGLKLHTEKLVRKIEELGKEKELRLLVAEVWGQVQDKLKIVRKRRYE